MKADVVRLVRWWGCEVVSWWGGDNQGLRPSVNLHQCQLQLTLSQDRGERKKRERPGFLRQSQPRVLREMSSFVNAAALCNLGSDHWRRVDLPVHPSLSSGGGSDLCKSANLPSSAFPPIPTIEFVVWTRRPFKGRDSLNPGWMRALWTSGGLHLVLVSLKTSFKRKLAATLRKNIKSKI